MKTTTRTFRINRRETALSAGLLTITVDGQSESYLFRQHTEGDGAGFTLCHAEDSERCYSVVVSPSRLSCTCKGFQFRSRCKHSSMCSALVAREAVAPTMPVTPPALARRSCGCVRCNDTGLVRTASLVVRCEACFGF